MKRTGVILVSLLYFSITYAQKTVDVLYLNDSSIIRGQIIGNNSKTVKIKTYCENIRVYPQSDILQIKREKYIDSRSIKTRGYFNFISGGVLLGSTANELRAPFSLLMEHNYRINRYVSLGFVSGLELLNEATVPLGFNIKGLLPLEGGTTVFLGGTIGYSFSVEDAKDPVYEVTDEYGGTLANAEIGLIFPSYGNLSFFMALGYRYNELSYSREDYYREKVDRSIFYNRLSLRVGVLFY